MTYPRLNTIEGRRLALSPLGGLVLTRDKDNTVSLLGEAIKTRITSAQVLALNGTPRTVVPAITGVAIIPIRFAIHKPAGTAYAGIGATEDLVLRYTNASGAVCSATMETTGFLDQASAQTRVAAGLSSGDFAPVSGAPIVLHLLNGEVTTGNSDLYVKVWFDVMETAISVNS